MYHTILLFWHLLRDLGGTLRERVGRYHARLAGKPTPLCVGWDAFPFFEDLTGVGWYSFHLLNDLSRRPGLRINLYGKTFRSSPEDLRVDLRDLGSAVRIRCHGVPARTLFPRRWLLAFLEGIVEPLFHLLDGNQIFFAPNFYPPPRLRFPSSPLIATVHDLTFKRFPAYVQIETLDLLTTHMPACCYRAAEIIAVSENTAKDMKHYYPSANGKVTPILSGIDPPPTGGDPGIPGRYLLFVSTIEPRKNLDVLLEAFTLLRAGGYEGSLVIAGKKGWKCDNTLRKMNSHPERAVIHLLDYVPREKLGALYEYADALAFPSHYEGFGFPVLEAMANRCPVIAAANSSILEVGGEACLFFDGHSPDELAGAVTRVISDRELRMELIRKGGERCREFSWPDAAGRTLEVFHRHAARCG